MEFSPVCMLRKALAGGSNPQIAKTSDSLEHKLYKLGSLIFAYGKEQRVIWIFRSIYDDHWVAAGENHEFRFCCGANLIVVISACGPPIHSSTLNAR
jgi:hypothetical protein